MGTRYPTGAGARNTRNPITRDGDGGGFDSRGRETLYPSLNRSVAIPNRYSNPLP